MSPRRTAPRPPPSRPKQGRIALTGGPLRALGRRYARNLLVGTDLGELRGERTERAAEVWSLAREALAEAAPDAEGSFATRLDALVEHAGGRTERVRVRGSPLEPQLRAVGRAAGLGREDLEILQFVAALRLVRGLVSFSAGVGPVATGTALDLVAAATGLSRRVVAGALGSRGRLVESGVVAVEPGAMPVEAKLGCDPRIADLLADGAATTKDVEEVFLREEPGPDLRLEDFAHAREVVGLAARVLAAALDRRERGVNLLVHGPPGCGKTELARVLARAAGARLHAAGTELPNGLPPGPPERLASLEAGQRLLARRRAAILFEEASELFEGGGRFGRGRPRMSRAWLGRFLSENAVPTIWTCEDPSALDPGLLGRFSLSVELPPLDAKARGKLLGQSRAGVRGLPRGEAARLARRYAASPAELRRAVRVAGLAAGGRAEPGTVEGLLDAGARLSGGPPPAEAAGVEGAYRVDLVNATVDVEALAARLAAPGRGAAPATLCLHGPPGTGKSEYVRHLAAVLDRPLLTRRVSEIESKWVGEAEKNLAAAFAEAERDGAILLLDEVDSFLRDRRKAMHRWEVTLTNEFLQLLERARGIVACTTNLYEDLDRAVLRRFTLRVGFGYLRQEQAASAFDLLLGPLVAGRRARVDRPAFHGGEGPFALGDFAVVARRAGLLGGEVTEGWLVGELRREAEERGGGKGPAIGFRSDAVEGETAEGRA